MATTFVKEYIRWFNIIEQDGALKAYIVDSELYYYALEWKLLSDICPEGVGHEAKVTWKRIDTISSKDKAAREKDAKISSYQIPVSLIAPHIFRHVINSNN